MNSNNVDRQTTLGAFAAIIMVIVGRLVANNLTVFEDGSWVFEWLFIHLSGCFDWGICIF